MHQVSCINYSMAEYFPENLREVEMVLNLTGLSGRKGPHGLISPEDWILRYRSYVYFISCWTGGQCIMCASQSIVIYSAHVTRHGYLLSVNADPTDLINQVALLCNSCFMPSTASVPLP